VFVKSTFRKPSVEMSSVKRPLGLFILELQNMCVNSVLTLNDLLVHPNLHTSALHYDVFLKKIFFFFL